MAYRPSALAAGKFEAIRAAAHAANGGTVLPFTAPKVRATLPADLYLGLDDREQRMSARRRWAMAARTTWSVFGLSVGSPWVPCYLCGRIFHAWTLDGEHVDPLAGSHPTNLALACHDCNRQKGDVSVVHPAIVDRIYAAGAGLGYVLGGDALVSMWGAADRRPDGSGMGSWEYGAARPDHLAPPRWVGSLRYRRARGLA